MLSSCEIGKACQALGEDTLPKVVEFASQHHSWHPRSWSNPIEHSSPADMINKNQQDRRVHSRLHKGLALPSQGLRHQDAAASASSVQFRCID
jgi:hypothetical protein